MFSFFRRLGSSSTYAYLNVAESTLSDTDEQDKEAGTSPVAEGISYRHAVLLYLLSFALAICLLVSLLKQPPVLESRELGSYETGFKTEIWPDRDTLALRKTKFYGGIVIDANGTYSLSHQPGEPNYFGPPRRETDHAWSKYLKDRFIGVLLEQWPPEAVKLSRSDDLVKGKWWIETSGVHALHCLNYIRRSFSPEYYTDHKDETDQRPPADPKTLTHSMHLRHCIEQVRQHLVCQLDMTPTPRTWRPGARVHHADTDQWHVCRDFDAMRTWMYPYQEFHK